MHQSYIMVEWRQPPSFQAMLLVFVPSTDWEGQRRNGSLADYLSRCISVGLFRVSLKHPQCSNFDFCPKMSRVYGKTGTLKTCAGHAIQSGVGERGRACRRSEKWMEKHVNGTQGGSQWINRSGDSPFLGLEWWLWAGVWGTQTASLNSPM